MQIYFIQSGCGGPVKIGITDNLDARVNQIQNGNPEPVEVVAAYDVVDRTAAIDIEKGLHEFFKWHRIRREWFRPSCLMYDFIGDSNLTGLRANLDLKNNFRAFKKTVNSEINGANNDAYDKLWVAGVKLAHRGDINALLVLVRFLNDLKRDLITEYKVLKDKE